MRLTLVVLAATLLASACGQPDSATAPGSAPGNAAGGPATSAPASPAAPAGMTPSAGPAAESGNAAPAPAAASPGLPGRTGELVNPDASTVVLLYYDLAGIELPLTRWVEADNRVQFAQPFDKEARRADVLAELQSAAAAVKGIGSIRLTMNAGLSDYDRTYGEFTVRSLAPSSTVPYDALGQKVALKFANGRTAQIWRVPEADAQLIRDKIGPYGGGNVSVDVLLRITGVQPAPGGGTISTEVLEYDLQEGRAGLTLGRVQVAR